MRVNEELVVRCVERYRTHTDVYSLVHLGIYAPELKHLAPDSPLAGLSEPQLRRLRRRVTNRLKGYS